MEIGKDIYYVGVNDQALDLFEGQYPLKQGVTYNSYVIKDEKIVIMDTVDKRVQDIWMENIEEKYNTESASINILFQIDEPDRELNRRLFGVFSVAQKKGRNRLVSVLTYSGKPVLRILDSYGIWRGKKKYREMRKDFLKLMGLREQDNHRSYWGDEE